MEASHTAEGQGCRHCPGAGRATSEEIDGDTTVFPQAAAAINAGGSCARRVAKPWGNVSSAVAAT